MADLFKGPPIDGVPWGTDPEVPEEFRPPPVITDRLLAEYLLAHPHGALKGPEFLTRDAAGLQWLVRWPNGSVKWESTASLRARNIKFPKAPVLGILST